MMRVSRTDTNRPRLAADRRRGPALGVLLLSGLLLTSCAVMPDSTSTAEWYRSVTEAVDRWFSDTPAVAPAPAPTPVPAPAPAAGTPEKQGEAEAPAKEGEVGFPKLSTVPDRPKTVTTPKDLEDLTRELEADRESARPPAPGGQSTLWPNTPPPPSVAGEAMTATRLGLDRERVSAAMQAPEAAKREPATARSEPETVEPAQQSEMAAAEPPPVATPAEPAAAQEGQGAAPALPETTPRPVPVDLAASATGAGESAEPAHRVSLTAVATPAPAERAAEPPVAPAPRLDLPLLPAASDQPLAPPPGFAVAPGYLPFPDPNIVYTAEQVGGEGSAATIHFAHGSAELSRSDRDLVGRIAATARQSGQSVRVIGHASSRTGDMDPITHSLVNLEMSVSRANAVAAILLEEGLPVERLTVDAVGDQQPLYAEVMPAGELANRRAEIFLVN